MNDPSTLGGWTACGAVAAIGSSRLQAVFMRAQPLGMTVKVAATTSRAQRPDLDDAGPRNLILAVLRFRVGSVARRDRAAGAWRYRATRPEIEGCRYHAGPNPAR
jgi:hypothetical protein